MKKNLLSLIGICCSLMAFAQFEGTVIWSFKMDITDPKMKAEMASAQKEMNSPSNQAKMQELEAKMNDPQMKAMMEKNPEMKAMIEKQIAMAKGGGSNSSGSMMDNMMPKYMEMKFKGSNSHTQVIGGAFQSEVLYLKDKDQSYMLDRGAKTYSIVDHGKNAPVEYKVTKTEEFATLLGYKSRKYIVETTENGQKITNNVWATTDIKDVDIKQFAKMKVGRGKNTSFMEKIDGVPLKMQMNSPQGQMVMEVTSFKKEAIPSSLFEIPADFKEKKAPIDSKY